MTDYQHPREALEAFLSEVGPLLPFYAGAVISVFGRKHPTNGSIEVIKSVIEMDPLKKFVERPTVEVADYVAGAFRLDAKVDDFLRKLVGDPRTDPAQAVDSPIGSLVFKTLMGPATMHPFDPSGPPNARLSTFSTIGRTHKPVEQPQLDWSLRSHAIPYRDVNDLSNEYGFGPLPPSNSLLDVRAHLIAAMDSGSTVSKGRARLGVRIPRLAFKNLVSVGVLIQTESPQIVRRRINGEDIDFQPAEENPEVSVGWFELDIPVDAVVQTYASYAGLSMNSWVVWNSKSVPNALRKVVEVFDDDLIKLKAGYAPVSMTNRKSGTSPELEHAVATLLWMTGFAAYRLAAAKSSNAVDLLARSPSGNILLVECSHGLLPSDKRQKLVKRANDVRDALGGTWFTRGVRVVPVMITSDTRESIRHTAEDARKEGIAVLTHDDLDDILGRTISPQDADELFRQLEAML